ncbi:cysteine-rich receptor-like protein kinase 44 isoform X2 [Miscanthus floridulus]|uniref:cysteine-rich receptor-like protein kinase 44 isoform X2 n=1 Tax=Miscanthus floridulus TaxID=154761 RepID=UPI00345AB180
MDFKLHDLETITSNFSDEQKVGSGGYGNVYKAVYNGEQIAVKKLHPLQGLDDKAFDSEFRNLSKVHHQNVVRLIGYCYESRHKYVQHDGGLVFAKERERILCFEYMQGGSLHEHIKDESCDLDWSACYQIIKGTCEGLNHLHNSQGKPIFHLDLKPANILLDKNMMTPKISDLGLSRLVASTKTHQTESREGTHGYMPPEYIDTGAISPKFDVFSLGVIIIKIIAGNAGYSCCYKMPSTEFIELVTENWKERLGKSSNPSLEIDILRLKTCVGIALRCVEAERNRRPYINDIINELEELEAEITEMSLSSYQSKYLIGQRRSDSSILSVDPTLELRFPFEPRKDITSCLQLTNITDGFIAYNIKTNQTKYYTTPNKGIMRPCSKCYIFVTLRAQAEAPPNMQCHDMFLVQSVNVSEGLTFDEVTEDFFKKCMVENVVDVVKLPIVYVAFT